MNLFVTVSHANLSTNYSCCIHSVLKVDISVEFFLTSGCETFSISTIRSPSVRAFHDILFAHLYGMKQSHSLKFIIMKNGHVFMIFILDAAR